jgi:hypothetical protein
MKLVYWFRPNHHWNVVTKECYEQLMKWDFGDYLRVTEEKQ